MLGADYLESSTTSFGSTFYILMAKEIMNDCKPALWTWTCKNAEGSMSSNLTLNVNEGWYDNDTIDSSEHTIIASERQFDMIDRSSIIWKSYAA